MGEKIKTFDKIKINNLELDIELNKATKKNGPRYIHLQNEFFRINFTESEFIIFITSVLKAEEKLRFLKGEKKYDE